jgi:hypothetical protein
LPLFTADQLERIRAIVRRYTASGLGSFFGGRQDQLTKQLREAGILEESESAPDLLSDAFDYGRLLGRTADMNLRDMSPEGVVRRLELNPAPPLDSTEQAIAETARRHAGQYMTNLADRITADVMGQITRLEGDLTPDQVRAAVASETARNREARASAKNLKSRLGERVGSWSRDWQRLATSEVNDAIQEGTALTFEKDHEDPFVSKLPRPDACSDCKRLYLNGDGDPKVWRLSKLRANGTNVGRKRADWQPTVGNVHPWCGCQLVRVPPGMVWSDGELVPRSSVKKSAFAVDLVKAGGPYIGPRGGKWADPEHTIPWKEGEHRYGMSLRAPAPGATPKGHTAVEEHKDFRHGVLVMPHKLSDEEAKKYDLKKLPTKAETQVAARKVVERLKTLIKKPEQLEDKDKLRDFVDRLISKQSPDVHLKGDDIIDQVVEELEEHHGVGEGSNALAGDYKPKVGDAHKVTAKGMHPIDARVAKIDGERAYVQNGDGPFGVWMPTESVRHFVNDLRGKIDVPGKSGNADVDTVLDGKGEHLGKGDDGIAFKVGDNVVKVSTTVPFQPFNAGHRSPSEAADMLEEQSTNAGKMADAGVPGILRSKVVRHGDKAFQIKPYVDIPEKLSLSQLDSIAASVRAAHEKGWAFNDQIQAGVHGGRLVHYDTGKASSDATDRQKQNDIEALEMLYREHGATYLDPNADHLTQWHKRLPLNKKALEGLGDGDRKKLAAEIRELAVNAHKHAVDTDDAFYDDGELISEEYHDALKDLDLKPTGDLELKITKSAFDDLDDLIKAASHKYLRRIPTGKLKPKYRYIYSVDSVHHGNEPKVGEKIRITHKGQVGHYHIAKVLDDGRVVAKHDETGDERTFRADALHDLFSAEHREKIDTKHSDLKEVHRQAKRTGNAKQKRRAAAQLQAFQERYDLDPDEGAADRIPATTKGRWAAYKAIHRLLQRAAAGHRGQAPADGMGRPRRVQRGHRPQEEAHERLPRLRARHEDAPDQELEGHQARPRDAPRGPRLRACSCPGRRRRTSRCSGASRQGARESHAGEGRAQGSRGAR